MQQPLPLYIGNTYHFNTRNVAGLASRYEMMSLESIMSGVQCRREYDVDVLLNHIKAHDVPGVGYSTVPESLIWYKFKTRNDEFIYIPNVVIYEDSIEVVRSRTLVIRMSGVDINQLNNIRAQLEVIPHSKLEIKEEPMIDGFGG